MKISYSILIREKITDHLKKSGIDYIDDRRGIDFSIFKNISNIEKVIWVDRKQLIHSSMNLFRNVEKYDLLRNLNVRYKNESGIDAGNSSQ